MEKFNIIKNGHGEEIAVDNPEYKDYVLDKKYKFLLKNSGLPEYYWDINWKDYKGEKSKSSFDKAVQYSKRCFEDKFKHVHLYLYGNNSSQKTAVACNIAKEIIKQGKNVKFVLAGTLIDKLMKVQGFTINEEINNSLDKLRYCDILLIDDVFDISKSIHWKNAESNSLILTAWDSFLREILVSDTKVIMTSNIEIELIKEKYGESIYQLIDRNFVCFQFIDNIRAHRKKQFENLFV